MSARSADALQQLPADLAGRLRALRGVDDLVLNVALAQLRDRRWATPALAAALQMNAPAVSKRVQRARQRHTEAREARAQRRAPAQGRHDDRARALEYQRARAAVAAMQLPKPPRVHMMSDGRRLDRETVERLRSWQQSAAKVNGATPVDHPAREDSEKLSAELNRLVVQEKFSPYYLSRELEVSPRAVTSRLERHHYRKPCPSVAGTASGEYYGRKIGDPGQGAPRLTRTERDQLRQAWADHQRSAGADSPATRNRLTGRLVTLMNGFLQRGFTLANLAQAMSTTERRVRHGDLRDVLEAVAG